MEEYDPKQDVRAAALQSASTLASTFTMSLSISGFLELTDVFVKYIETGEKPEEE